MSHFSAGVFVDDQRIDGLDVLLVSDEVQKIGVRKNTKDMVWRRAEHCGAPYLGPSAWAKFYDFAR